MPKVQNSDAMDAVVVISQFTSDDTGGTDDSQYTSVKLDYMREGTYAPNDGDEYGFDGSEAIPRRNSRGNLVTNIPENPYECANKKYVDEAINSIPTPSGDSEMELVAEFEVTESDVLKVSLTVDDADYQECLAYYNVPTTSTGVWGGVWLECYTDDGTLSEIRLDNTSNNLT